MPTYEQVEGLILIFFGVAMVCWGLSVFRRRAWRALLERELRIAARDEEEKILLEYLDSAETDARISLKHQGALDYFRRAVVKGITLYDIDLETIRRIRNQYL